MQGQLGQVDFRFRLALTVLLLTLCVFGVVDVLLDLEQPEPPSPLHLAFEAGFVTLALASTVVLWSGWMRTRRTLTRTEERLHAEEEEREAWRGRAGKLLRGLGEEIDTQFARWHLTPTEREVALLVLKGLEHKQIAALLERSERTVRQHAVAVYRKSGLSGRAELSAFFLEDLLLPMREDSAGGAAEDDAAGGDPAPDQSSRFS
jgi:DNA-binding CsgD family transcriptional regulator